MSAISVFKIMEEFYQSSMFRLKQKRRKKERKKYSSKHSLNTVIAKLHGLLNYRRYFVHGISKRRLVRRTVDSGN